MAKIRNTLHIEVIPSPGTQNPDWKTMEEKIKLVLPFVQSLHIDLLDGKFAPNTTSLDPMPFAKYAKEVILEAHFMTENPLQYIKPFAKCGFQRFIGQIEKMDDVAGFVGEAQLWGEVGLAVDTQTPVEKLFPFLEDIDVALIMTVKAGWSNQQFLPTMLEKVGRLREKEELLTIEVDGGVTDENITAIRDAGATRFVSTGFVFNGNSEEQYHKLLKLLK